MRLELGHSFQACYYKVDKAICSIDGEIRVQMILRMMLFREGKSTWTCLLDLVVGRFSFFL